ncbi:DMT family transporter [Rhizobacter sp. Root1221]|uniref:DMT family transporter n=1 Tax=Rhizobacter sp. Root1221 TaxID=1736433 RepID=UPI0006F82C66|nr:DMT family transporter [Rhizobacter sp. Root1221]KQV92826.1 hypothetical protein ASC87_27565 [Rhizobacter sp. Root1221]
MTTALPSLAALYVRLACVPLIWGGTFIAARVVSAHLPPATAAALRFVFAALALLAAVRLSRGWRAMGQLGWRQLAATAALGATGVLAYNLLFFRALAVLPAGRASVIVALTPVVTLVLAAVVLGDRLSPRRWGGVVMALAGVWAVVTRGDLSQLAVAAGRGELAMFGAVCAWAVYTLVGRTMLREVPPLVATAWAAVWGVIFLVPVAWFERAQVRMADVTIGTFAGLVFLGVLGTAVGFVWYSEGVQRLGSDRAVVFNNLVPVFGVALGWMLLGEPVGSSALLGGALAVAGVFVVNRAA